MERNEAIDTVKLYWPIDEGGPVLREAIETLIPELKESEDEKIRKEIITFLDYYHTGNGGHIDFNPAWIAWLEKQGEKQKLYATSINLDSLPILELEKEGSQNLANSAKSSKDWQKQPIKYTLEQAARIFLDALSDTPYNNKPVTDAQVITKELLKFLSDTHSYNPNAINEQNPAWSEEDERHINTIVSVIRGGTHYAYEDELTWLKALKDRVQPHQKQEWSEEDEEAYNTALDALYYKDCNDKDDVIYALEGVCELISQSAKSYLLMLGGSRVMSRWNILQRLLQLFATKVTIKHQQYSANCRPNLRN